MGIATDDPKQLIRAVTTALFEPGADMCVTARWLGVAPATLRRWLSPDGYVPPDIVQRLEYAISAYQEAVSWNMYDAMTAMDNFKMMAGASPGLAAVLQPFLEDAA
jgi:hypothetical protein